MSTTRDRCRRLARAALLALGLLTCAGAPSLAAIASQHQQPVTSIVMLASASVKGDEPVTLAQIAKLTGPDAQTLGSLIVLDATLAPTGTAGAIVVPRERVEAALAKGNVNWSRTLLRGRATSLLIEAASDTRDEDVASAAPTPPQAPQPTTQPARQAAPVPTISAPATEAPPPSAGTPRALIIAQIARELGRDERDVRVDFEGRTTTPTTPTIAATPATGSPTANPPTAWLDQPIPSDWQVRLGVSGFGVNGRTPVRFEAFAGDRVVLDQSLQALTRLRVQVPVASTALARDAIITPSDLRLEERWQPAGQVAPPEPESMTGWILRRRIEPGRPVTPADLTTPLVVRRGDELWVECISGPMVVKAKARALESARDGELVRLAIDNSKKTITARMNGRGRAVLRLDDTPPGSQDPLVSTP
jgi:flagella basal body P-ring formation protein FlgA